MNSGRNQRRDAQGEGENGAPCRRRPRAYTGFESVLNCHSRLGSSLRPEGRTASDNLPPSLR